MSAQVETVYPDAEVADACRLLAQMRVGALPVVDRKGELVGIISVTDVLVRAAGLFAVGV